MSNVDKKKLKAIEKSFSKKNKKNAIETKPRSHGGAYVR